ncbi:hypothetical protein [Tissierella sp. Yu-01]|uniref:hypothetical protein n=1 Tax=Tissierella sp. Yu-01 TaxID=3035694 RepID=UPI00240CF733|nr:hypothetical protein [Tissierella sp. Yu-01]WFA10326.1 hypothetical protein P3962_07180 [Tissierella sp. Yu-01]
MYPVTQEFKEKILLPDRKIYGRVEIDYTDPFLDNSIEAIANENANISYPEQTTDSVNKSIGKVASLDGSWKLDGTYHLYGSGIQLGWWGKQFSDDNGFFIFPFPTLTVTFHSRVIHSLKVVGDEFRKEYPEDFKISLLNTNDEILYEETVTENNQVNWSKEIDPVSQVSKMKLEIYKWNLPHRQAKILEFFTSVKGIYEGEEIISINLLEEIEGASGKTSIGNVSSNEITVTLRNDNTNNRPFDAGNTQSPLYEMLKPNRRIKAYIGIKKDNDDMELVPLGTFWSGDWDVNEKGVSAKVTGWDRLKFLSDTNYGTNGILENCALYDLAVDVLIDAGLNEGEFWIDDELKDYIIPYVLIENKSHREVLRMIAEACLGYVYCDRKGIIRVEGTKPVSQQYEVMVNEQANISYPNQLVDGYEEADGLFASLDGSWNLEGNNILAGDENIQLGWWGKQLSNVNGYFVAPYPKAILSFQPKAIEAIKVVGDEFRKEYPVDYTITIYDSLDNVLSQQNIVGNTDIRSEVEIPENPTNVVKIELEITKWSHPGRQVKILEFIDILKIIEIPPKDYFTKNNPVRYSDMINYVEVEAQPIDAEGNKLDIIKVIAKDDENISQNGLGKFTLKSNSLIQTEEMACNIANRLLESFKIPRRNLDLDWRGNPAVLLRDTISLLEKKETNLYKVTKHELEFSGGLRARLSGRRVIE